MLTGRLGLETARIPHADRHGLVWLARCNLYVDDGTLRIKTAGFGDLEAGDYALPYQGVSTVLLGPGSTVSHDALRLLARHGTALVCVGEDGVRFYASMPAGADDSALARKQAMAWADAKGKRLDIARRMYAWRLGEVLPSTEIEVLRGVEGARARKMYQLLAEQHGIQWHGRRYDRSDPGAADPANQAINHAASAVEAASMIAIASTSTLPQLGFIHEDSAVSFALDLADLFRDEVTVSCAFAGVREHQKQKGQTLESVVRRLTGRELQRKQVVPKLIDKIKELFVEP